LSGRRGLKGYILIALLLFSACTRTADEPTDARREITGMLESQKASWNSGDLEGYMEHYIRSYNLTFHGGSRLIRGWENLFRMYRENYAGKKMGQLDFSNVKVRFLCDDSAFVTGAWQVQQPDTARGGRFTLVLRKTEGRWRIVHDHSS
jgi:uncharacterized protein (TIGR02246 family)